MSLKLSCAHVLHRIDPAWVEARGQTWLEDDHDGEDMAPTFITPNATMSSISAQQQPRQDQPWLAQARTSRSLPVKPR